VRQFAPKRKGFALVTGGTTGIDDGMPRATINDVARLSGVSKKTVSRVINASPLVNPHTRERVESVIAETGYVPNAQARMLARGRGFMVALVHDGMNPGVVELVQNALLDALKGSDHVLVPCPLDPSVDTGDDARDHAGVARQLVRFLEQHRPAGVILLPQSGDRNDLIATCARFDAPCERIGARCGHEVDVLSAHDRIAMAALVAWLAALGHRRIGFVAGPEDSIAAQQRELGYLDAMAEHGLDRGPALIAPGDYGFSSGVEAGDLLLQISPRPSAIAAANDEMAAGVLHAAAMRGLTVPGDLSVTGFDDTALAPKLWPPLTSVHVPWAAAARVALTRLVPGLSAPERYGAGDLPRIVTRQTACEWRDGSPPSRPMREREPSAPRG
jgi:LacI family transcriptional regulator